MLLSWGGVGGRGWRTQILDVVLIANKVADNLLRKGGWGVFCKLDMEKAYDHVVWSFLFYIMKRMNFRHK